MNDHKRQKQEEFARQEQLEAILGAARSARNLYNLGAIVAHAIAKLPKEERQELLDLFKKMNEHPSQSE